MAWEKRGNREYYYRKRRVGRRVVSEYVGAGELAEAIATLEAFSRQEQEMERAAWREEQEAERAFDQEIDAVGDLVRTMTGAVLLATGHHTHKGQWRRRRG